MPTNHTAAMQANQPSARLSAPTSLAAGANRLSWVAQVVAAVILGQTLFFKFSAAPEAVAIFTKLGVEPFGRIGLGVFELVAVVLLLVPRTAALGGALTLGLMVGAIGSHLGPLGIEVEGDGGQLFALAVVALVAGAVVTWLRRRELPVIGTRFGARA
ncbi:MAG: DoxX family protein [Planctomycetota bacterium]